MSEQNLEARTITTGQPLEDMLSVFGVPLRARVAKKIIALGYFQSAMGAAITSVGYVNTRVIGHFNEVAHDTYYVDPSSFYFVAVGGAIMAVAAFALATNILFAYVKYKKHSQPGVQVS